MGIKEICKSIQDFMDTYTRKPFPAIAGLIMACSLAKRPGLSVIMSTSNVLSSLNCYGISTEDMPNGEPNKTNAFVKSILSEVFRAIQQDMKIQTTLIPGTLKVVGSPFGMTNTEVSFNSSAN